MKYIDLTNMNIQFNKVNNTFIDYYQLNTEKNYLIGNLYTANVTNGKTICLEYLDVDYENNMVKLKISLGNYFDLLLSNLLLIKDINSLDDYFINKVNQYREFILNEGNLLSPYLSKAIATSVLVHDKNNNYLLTQRSSKVATAQNFYSVSATGGLDEKDYYTQNPIISNALNELKEELNLDSEEIVDIKIRGINFADGKLQPIFLIDCTVEHFNLEEICFAEDFKIETKKIFIEKKKNLINYLDNKMTDSSRLHIKINTEIIEGY